MRVLFLVPGGVEAQLHCLPAAAQVAEGLGAQLQVACAPTAASAWSLLPAVAKLIPFDFNSNPTLADWANLLGNVREPDFQACINLASGRQVDSDFQPPTPWAWAAAGPLKPWRPTSSLWV